MAEYNKTRRDFIKKTCTASAAILMSNLISCKKENIEGQSGWFKGKQVNPYIDNLRIVCSHDPSMLRGNPQSWDMISQNSPVVKERVHINLDQMATALAETSSATSAWQKIFRKPQDKKWEDVKVAIKVNSIFKNHPRLAVVEKICIVLHELEIPYSNIIIYDAISDASKHYSDSIGKDIPNNVIVSKKSDALGGMIQTYIPQPNTGMYRCVKDIAEGKIDIIVNIAVNKGCNKTVGNLTLTLKNHAGTFNPKPIHFEGGMDYLLAFNKSEAIVGGTPVRQQLCIVDSLWAQRTGPWGTPDSRLSRLVMGTFSPAVDYLTAKKIREPLLNVKHGPIYRFLTSFGYEIPPDLDLVNIAPTV
jgi:hypothetical protein